MTALARTLNSFSSQSVKASQPVKKAFAQYDSKKDISQKNSSEANNSERRSYLDHLSLFDHAVRQRKFDQARTHLRDAQIPADQIDAILARIEMSPGRYGYSA